MVRTAVLQGNNRQQCGNAPTLKEERCVDLAFEWQVNWLPPAQALCQPIPSASSQATALGGGGGHGAGEQVSHKGAPKDK